MARHAIDLAPQFADAAAPMARIWLAALFSSSSRRPDATSSSSASAWPDMVVGAHAERVEAQRLLALASHGNHD